MALAKPDSSCLISSGINTTSLRALEASTTLFFPSVSPAGSEQSLRVEKFTEEFTALHIPLLVVLALAFAFIALVSSDSVDGSLSTTEGNANDWYQPLR